MSQWSGGGHFNNQNYQYQRGGGGSQWSAYYREKNRANALAEQLAQKEEEVKKREADIKAKEDREADEARVKSFHDKIDEKMNSAMEWMKDRVATAGAAGKPLSSSLVRTLKKQDSNTSANSDVSEPPSKEKMTRLQNYVKKWQGFMGWNKKQDKKTDRSRSRARSRKRSPSRRRTAQSSRYRSPTPDRRRRRDHESRSRSRRYRSRRSPTPKSRSPRRRSPPAPHSGRSTGKQRASKVAAKAAASEEDDEDEEAEQEPEEDAPKARTLPVTTSTRKTGKGKNKPRSKAATPRRPKKKTANEEPEELASEILFEVMKVLKVKPEDLSIKIRSVMKGPKLVEWAQEVAAKIVIEPIAKALKSVSLPKGADQKWEKVLRYTRHIAQEEAES
eukprot:TRINITY_DN7932_c0_g1_i3.p1 TRINITY_DN7932_c0_g1~~TRINITY_DN7932_c0_g1_i3.p1  ORF type:complete len:450 (+),score=122.33 TRINITY_DN7932_c0_g1_i3:186-1352(+)